MTIKAVISGDITISGLSPQTVSLLKSLLSFPNPAAKLAKMAGKVRVSEPEMKCVAEDMPGGAIRIPRGAQSVFTSLLAADQKVLWEDRRSEGSSLEITEFNGKPYFYQTFGAQMIKKYKEGMVIIPCGGGKTTLGLLAVQQIARSTLIIVPTRDLVVQWSDRITELFNMKPAIYANSKRNFGPITVATAAGLARIAGETDELEKFGFVIFDECHMTAAPTFQNLLPHIPAFYRLGLTATPYRDDGQDQLLYWSFGNRILLRKTIEDLIDLGLLMRPEVIGVATDFYYSMPPMEDRALRDYSVLNKEIAKDRKRNEIIVGVAKKLKTATLILTNNISHCHVLKDLLTLAGHTSCEVITSMKSIKTRSKLLNALRNSEVNILIATSLGDQGLDVVPLEYIILALPLGARGRTVQQIGRLMRPYKGKYPVVYDIVDNKVPTLFGRWRKRQRAYKEAGAKVSLSEADQVLQKDPIQA